MPLCRYEIRLPTPRNVIGVAPVSTPLTASPPPLERHAHEIGAGLSVEVVHEQGEGHGRGRVAQCAGLGLRQRRKLGQASHLQRRIGHQRLRQEEQIGDRRDALLGVEARSLVEILIIGDHLVRHDADGGAVRRRFGASAAADIHAAAGAVLDDDRLAPALAQLLAHRAHEGVADPAGCRRGDHPDRLCRIVLRPRNARECERCADRRDQQGRAGHGVSSAFLMLLWRTP